MLSFKHIMVPTDFSERSLMVLPYAVELAQKFGADLRLVSVHEPLPSISDLAWQGTEEATRDQEAFERAKRGLDDIARERVPEQVSCKVAVVRGQTVKKLMEYVKENDIDLVIAATHGRTGFAHALMGSVAEQLVRKLPCPVLTLKQPLEQVA